MVLSENKNMTDPRITLSEPENYGFDVIGISHTVEEADKRLYEKAEEIARDMAKGHHVINLEDLTRHFQSLPRGGK